MLSSLQIECMNNSADYQLIAFFKYPVVLFYMFLYYQTDKFPVSIQKLDTRGKERSVVCWTCLVHKFSTTFTYKDFIYSFVYLIMNMLTSNTQPRISLDIKRVLQLAKNSKVGDWYLYQNHNEIKVYGCQLAPYIFPKYLPMRIFSLECFRHIINSNEVHFLFSRKKTQFKVKNQLGPFICKNREARPEAVRLLQQMKFKNSFIWKYDLHGVISKLRLKVKLGPYIHHPRPDIEQFSNQIEWVEIMLIDMDNVITQSFVEFVRRRKGVRGNCKPAFKYKI